MGTEESKGGESGGKKKGEMWRECQSRKKETEREKERKEVA